MPSANVDGFLTALPKNVAASGALGALNNAVSMRTEGLGTVLWEVDAGTLTGTIILEGTIDDTTWFAVNGHQIAEGVASGSSFTKSSGTALRGYFDFVGFSQVRIRVSVYTSGSSNARLLGSEASSPAVRLTGVAGLSTTNLGAVSFAANQAVRIMYLSAAGAATAWREPDFFVALNAVAVNPAASIWTPTATKTFRLLGYHLAGSVAGVYLLRDGAGGTLIAVVPSAAGGSGAANRLGATGIASAAADNVLECLGPASATISGTLFGQEN